MSITATNNPYPTEPDASPSKLDRGGYEGTAQILDEKINENFEAAKALIESYKGSDFLGSITPSSTPTGTGKAFWLATQSGTYTNFGGVVVSDNSFAVISRNDAGVFSISQTALDISSKVNVSDIKNDLISIDVNKPLSANQGKLLNEKFSKYPTSLEVNPLKEAVGYNVVNASQIVYAGTFPSTAVLTDLDTNIWENKSLVSNRDYDTIDLSFFRASGVAPIYIYVHTGSLFTLIDTIIPADVSTIQTKKIKVNVPQGSLLAVRGNIGYYDNGGIGIQAYDLNTKNATVQYAGFLMALKYTLSIVDTEYISVQSRIDEITKSEIIYKSNSELFNHTIYSPTGYTFFNSTPSEITGVVNHLKINGRAGIISVLVIDYNIETNTAIIVSESEKTIREGINEVDLSLQISQGQYVALYTGTSGVYYANTGTHSHYYSANKLTDGITSASNMDIDFKFTIANLTEIDALKEQVNILSKKESIQIINKTVVENETKFTGWENLNFSIVNNTMQSAVDGGVLTSTKIFGIDNRVFECAFIPTSSTTKFVIATLPREGAIASGSAIRVNLVNNRVELLTRYNGTIGTVVESFEPSFTLTSNVKYKIQIELSGRVFNLKIAKENTIVGFKMFDGFEELGKLTALPYGYQNYSNLWNYNAGTMQGSARLINESGGVKVISFLHYLKCNKKPIIYICGDSITEGFSVDDNSKYGGLLKEYLSKSDVVISGIGGTTSNGALVRVQTELLRLKPEYFIPFFGSNPEAGNLFYNGMKALIDLAILKGCKVLLCSIPTDAYLTTFINTLSTEYSLPLIDFRTVLTNSGVVYPELYSNIDGNNNTYSDNLHPNPLGHYLMFNEVLKYI